MTQKTATMVSFGITTVLALVASLTPSAAFAPKSFGLARPVTVSWRRFDGDELCPSCCDVEVQHI